MNEQIKWKAEIEFEGSEEELTKVAEALHALPVVVRIPGWVKPGPYPGIVPIEAILGKDVVAHFVERGRVLNIRPGLINGGYPGPHIHLDGKLILLEREQFVELVGETAKRLASQLAATEGDYVKVTEPLMNFSQGS